MTFKQGCLVAGFVSLAVATFGTDYAVIVRVLFFVHGIMFIVAFDAIKDVEKAKRKERDLTEIRMQQEMLTSYDKSLDSRYEQFISTIGNTSDTLLKQLATYVRTGTPDRTCTNCEKESS